MYVLLYSSDRNVDEPIVYLPRPMPASMHITSEHFWHTWTIRYTIIHIHGSYHHNTTYECHEILLKALPGPMLFALNCASLRSGHSKLLKVSGQHRINLEGLDSEILAYQKIRQCLKGLQFASEYPQFSTLSIHWVKPSHTASGLRTLAFSGKLGATWAKNITCWVTIWADARPKKIWQARHGALRNGWTKYISLSRRMACSSSKHEYHGVLGYFWKENCKNSCILLQLAQQAHSHFISCHFSLCNKQKESGPPSCHLLSLTSWIEFHVRRSIKLQGNAWRPPRTSQSHAYCYRRHKRKNSQRKKYIAQLLSAATPEVATPGLKWHVRAVFSAKPRYWKAIRLEEGFFCSQSSK